MNVNMEVWTWDYFGIPMLALIYADDAVNLQYVCNRAQLSVAAL